ncbi:MAG TPA: nucleotidyl transferase AbiEii/AbiGii toxin family protein [Oligoflexia bacterium]|nr:nucleotidyl transferase AbiEii/AbiGii toxin family protein [Oligoflexia bacterium]HMP48980.1 nucleotidyl transferase AbiEii/AbiGii toxin family protein [Oligoflexia bacterium]
MLKSDFKRGWYLDRPPKFELKGGTSLSKAWKIISRFSEDVDIHIHPPDGMEVFSGKNNDKPNHIASRNDFYNWLPKNIKVNGAISINRNPQ